MARKKKGRGGRSSGGAGPEEGGGTSPDTASASETGGGRSGRRSARSSRSGPGTGVGEPLAIPSWVPAAAFLGVTVVLFRSFIFSDQMLFGSDTLGLGYVARALYGEWLSVLGSIPSWAPEILGGTPFLEALASGDALYPPSLLLLLLTETYRSLGWKLVIHVAAAGFFMFGWARSLGVSRAAALVSGLAYMLAPYFISLVQAGHDGKLFVTALAPLLFWAVEHHLRKTGIRSVAAIAFVVGMVILTTHFQMAYFLFAAVGMYAIFRSFQIAGVGASAAYEDDPTASAGAAASTAAEDGGAREGTAGRPSPSWSRAALPFGTFLFASVLGAGIAAVQLLPAIDYVREHSRRIETTREAAGESGVAWSSSWSIHPEEVMSLVIPEFSGVTVGQADWTSNTYWGRNTFKLNHEGAGLVVLLLAVAAFGGGALRAHRFFFLGLGLLATLFAVGTHTPVWRILYEVPGISYFRAPSQVMFLFQFAAATLAALGVDRILQSRDDPEVTRDVLKALGGGAAVVAVLSVLAGSGALTSFWASVVYAVPENRLASLRLAEPFIARGAGIAFMLAAATFALTWAWRTGRVPVVAVVAGLSLLVVGDEMRVSSPFVHTRDFHEWAEPDGFVSAIVERERGAEEPYRMLSFRDAGQDVLPALHGIELAGGHHPNDLARYRELIGMTGSGVPLNLVDPEIRRLLNIRYVLWPDYDFGGGFPSPTQELLLRSQLQDGTPYESLHLEADLPRARLVGAAVVRPGAEAVEYMLSDAFDPEREVVLAEAPPIELSGEAAVGEVTWVERTADRLELTVRTERAALLVVADNWFPAWRATVDGAEAPVLRAYHTLRAVPVPAGEHTVEMTYHSTVVATSWLISLLIAGGLLLAVGAQFVRERKVTEP